MKDNELPIALRLITTPGSSRLMLATYDEQLEAVGVKISDDVNVLHRDTLTTPIWVSIRLYELSFPVRIKAVVLATTQVVHFHTCLQSLVDFAYTGECACPIFLYMHFLTNFQCRMRRRITDFFILPSAVVTVPTVNLFFWYSHHNGVSVFH